MNVGEITQKLQGSESQNLHRLHAIAVIFLKKCENWRKRIRRLIASELKSAQIERSLSCLVTRRNWRSEKYARSRREAQRHSTFLELRFWQARENKKRQLKYLKRFFPVIQGIRVTITIWVLPIWMRDDWKRLGRRFYGVRNWMSSTHLAGWH